MTFVRAHDRVLPTRFAPRLHIKDAVDTALLFLQLHPDIERVRGVIVLLLYLYVTHYSPLMNENQPLLSHKDYFCQRVSTMPERKLRR